MRQKEIDGKNKSLPEYKFFFKKFEIITLIVQEKAETRKKGKGAISYIYDHYKCISKHELPNGGPREKSAVVVDALDGHIVSFAQCRKI
jgi:hypothetical protein